MLEKGVHNVAVISLGVFLAAYGTIKGGSSSETQSRTVQPTPQQSVSNIKRLNFQTTQRERQ